MNCWMFVTRLCFCFFIFKNAVTQSSGSSKNVATHAVNISNDFSYRVGSTHWNGCYYLSNDPFLIDGAKTISTMGSKVIKLALTNPSKNYPWNSNWSSNLTTPLSIAQTQYFNQVFNMNFETYILVVFSSLGASYWHNGITPQQYQTEYNQIYQLSIYLLQNFVLNKNKTFILQNWEGDWAVRGNYNKSYKPTNASINGMIEWYKARQSAVSQARMDMDTGMDIGIRIASKENGYESAGYHVIPASVYLAAEVNLVKQAMETQFPDTILSVIPYVSLDMISYSSYDTFCTTNFSNALNFIKMNHNRTNMSPDGALSVYIGEFGLAQMEMSLDKVKYCTEYAINVSYSFGCSFIMWWEVYGNQCIQTLNDKNLCDDNNRCIEPIFNISELQGFWLVMPNGTHSWTYDYFQSLYV